MTATTVTPASAQSDDERARAHFESGRSYYDQARYDDAAREFQQAFDLSGRTEMLLNLSQAQERALRYDDAISSARRYLELEPEATDRKTIEDRIVNLQDLKQRFETGGPKPTPAPGEIDPETGQPVPADPAATPAPTDPNAPPTAATIGGKTETAPPAAIEPTRSDPNRFTIPAIVLMGTGGAALVASLVTGLVAHADYKSLQRNCKPNGDCPASAEDELDEGETLSVVSTLLTVVGVLAAGTGTALLIIGANEEPEPAAQLRPGQLAIAPGPTPLSLAASLSF